MSRRPARGKTRILTAGYRVPDGWFSFLVADASDALAVELGRCHADTPAGQAFLTNSLVSLIRNAVEDCVGRLFIYVPDRRTGEVVAFARGSTLVIPRGQDATAEAYAARSPRKIGGANFKVLGHSASVVQCPAGPAACVFTLQRRRYTTSTLLEADFVIFPPYEGLREGVRIRMYSTHLELEEDMGRWCRTIAEGVDTDVGYADGTILATFGDDSVDVDGSGT